jgi:long-chain acyl-CoA synthetase
MANTVPQMFLERVTSYPDLTAQYAKDESGEFKASSFATLLGDIKVFAAGLLELGLARGEHVGLIADNRREWLIADLAILGLGGADVPRGCDATEQEIRYILDYSECRMTLLENEKQLAKVVKHKKGIPGLAIAILFDAASPAAAAEAEAAGLKVATFGEVCALGAPRAAARASEYEESAAAGKREELATIIYTSGTTGEPKGVMLSHGNFLHQTDFLPTILHILPGHVFL